MFGFRHLRGIPGIGGVARIAAGANGATRIVLYAVDQQLEPDRQQVFESLDQAWLEGGSASFEAYEVPRGWPDRAQIAMLVPVSAPQGNVPTWQRRDIPFRVADEIVAGLWAIGYFDPDHPENGGRGRNAASEFIRNAPPPPTGRVLPFRRPASLRDAGTRDRIDGVFGSRPLPDGVA